MIKLKFTKETIIKLLHNEIYHPQPIVRTKSQSCIIKHKNIPYHRIDSPLDIWENTLRGYFQQYQGGDVE